MDGIRKLAVFTSAGNRHNVAQWIESHESRTWDIIVAYYGEDREKFAKIQAISDVCYPAKGSKFQNLKLLYQKQPGLMSQYDFIFVCDDDLVFDNGGIDRAFEISQQFDLWVSQPAFSRAGKISHPITARVEGCDLRLVNFVEVTCPLFRADKLRKFLDVYDGELAGLGVDWWYCSILMKEKNYRFAILDSVTVINPHDATKSEGGREIDRLQSTEDRVKHWYRSMKEFHYGPHPQQTYASISLNRQKTE